MDSNSEIITTTPLVSIIMLTHNRADYISLAIESALTQTYQNFELLIIDDGSTDNTAEVVAQFSDPRIKYIKDSVNKGLYARRSESIAHVTGKYMAILDSDDLWTDNEKLALQVAYLEANPTCAVIGTFITIIDEHGHETGKNYYHTTDAEIRNNMLYRNQFANSSVMMRKALLDKTNGYQNLPAGEDFELFLQLGQLGSFANLARQSMAYRVHPGNVSAQKIIVIHSVLKIIEMYKNNYPGYCKARLKFKLYGLLILLKSLVRY
jgi:glycosyltransferase involved in cell wall biosynthesis